MLQQSILRLLCNVLICNIFFLNTLLQYRTDKIHCRQTTIVRYYRDAPDKCYRYLISLDFNNFFLYTDSHPFAEEEDDDENSIELRRRTGLFEILHIITEEK